MCLFVSVDVCECVCVPDVLYDVCFSSSAYLISISIVPGSGFENYTGGIIQADLIYKNNPMKAVICDYERDGSKIDARTLCYLLG